MIEALALFSFPGKIMTHRMKLIITLTLVVLLGGMGAADYYFSGNEYAAQLTEETTNDVSEGTQTKPPAGAVAKAMAPAINDIATDINLSVQPSNDLSLLTQIVNDGTTVESLAVLQNGDRAGSVTWVESPNVKNYFSALKEALLSAFSAEVRDLRDETLQEPEKPVRNILTFIDPSLSEERIVFIRIRERLYEFHIASGKEETMNDLIDGLTGR